MKRAAAWDGRRAGRLRGARLPVHPPILSDYYIFLATTAVISAVALQSLGIVSGRAGMFSLCQMSFAAIGAYTVAWINVHDGPGDLLLWIVLGGLAAVPFGLAVGLPSLRLRSINLAVATLGFATCADVILGSTSFPGQTDFIPVPRPRVPDRQAVLQALAGRLRDRRDRVVDDLAQRLGASWMSIAHSERATAAHGISVPRSSFAFALSAFIAGVSGGLLAGQLGTLVAGNFSVMQLLVLFALATMAGAHYAEGAIFGGVLGRSSPRSCAGCTGPRTWATSSSRSGPRRRSAPARPRATRCAAPAPSLAQAGGARRGRRSRRAARARPPAAGSRRSRSATSRAFGSSRRWTASTWSCRRARSPRSSAPTARASPRSSTRSPASWRATRDRQLDGRPLEGMTASSAPAPACGARSSRRGSRPT